MALLSYHFGTGSGPVHRHRSPADLDLPGGAVAGRPDAVRLDFDGDGRVDDALWDVDGDGVVDRAVLDLDDDGRPERAFADPSGRGVWDARAEPPAAGAAPAPGDSGGGSGLALGSGVAAGSLDDRDDDRGGDPNGGPGDDPGDDDRGGPGDAGRPVRWTDVRGREHTAPAVLDTDGDGVADGAVVEADHDDRTREVVCDLDGDGVAEQLLVDLDGDGRMTDAYTVSDPRSARWDVLLEDSDGDGAVDTVVDEGAPGWVPP